MAKAKPIKDTVHVGKTNLIKLAATVRKKVVIHVTKRHKDVKGKQFKPYSSQEPFFFFNKKAGKVVRAQGYKQAKAEGKFRKQSSTSQVPDLQLSGDMMRGMIIQSDRATDDLIPIGWVNPKSTQKLIWNESKRGKKRTVAKNTGDFPFSKDIGDWFFKSVDKILDKKVKKTSSKVVFKINM